MSYLHPLFAQARLLFMVADEGRTAGVSSSCSHSYRSGAICVLFESMLSCRQLEKDLCCSRSNSLQYAQEQARSKHRNFVAPTGSLSCRLDEAMSLGHGDLGAPSTCSHKPRTALLQLPRRFTIILHLISTALSLNQIAVCAMDFLLGPVLLVPPPRRSPIRWALHQQVSRYRLSRLHTPPCALSLPSLPGYSLLSANSGYTANHLQVHCLGRYDSDVHVPCSQLCLANLYYSPCTRTQLVFVANAVSRLNALPM